MDLTTREDTGWEPIDPPAGGPARQAPHVLVIEDDSLVSTDIRMSLTEMGYRATCASGSVDEGMRTLRRNLHKIDFVLLDAELSGGSCLPLAHVMDAARVPYMIVSGHDELDIRAMGLTAPCLGKPFGETDLMAAMLRHMPLDAAAEERARLRFTPRACRP